MGSWLKELRTGSSHQQRQDQTSWNTSVKRRANSTLIRNAFEDLLGEDFEGANSTLIRNAVE
ncbi:hypothetical protein, partial [Xanthomonas oryzae]|uniref:hypothetical protein n=1 Tax=Xanthomonas oryzae TaxID=347 RepID=UPI001C4A5CCA